MAALLSLLFAEKWVVSTVVLTVTSQRAGGRSATLFTTRFMNDLNFNTVRPSSALPALCTCRFIGQQADMLVYYRSWMVAGCGQGKSHPTSSYPKVLDKIYDGFLDVRPWMYFRRKRLRVCW